MTKERLTIISTLVLLVLVGCGVSTLSEKSEYEANRKKWSDIGITDYEFKYRYTIFLARDEEWKVVVRDGDVITKEHITTTDRDDWDEEYYPTIDTFFDVVSDEIEHREEQYVSVEYDVNYYFPTSAVFDSEKEAFGFMIYDFKELNEN